MKTTSDLYKAILAGEHRKESRLVIAGVEYLDGDIINLSTRGSLYPTLGIGKAAAKQIDFAILPKEQPPKQAMVEASVRLVGSYYHMTMEVGHAGLKKYVTLYVEIPTFGTYATTLDQRYLPESRVSVTAIGNTVTMTIEGWTGTDSVYYDPVEQEMERVTTNPPFVDLLELAAEGTVEITENAEIQSEWVPQGVYFFATRETDCSTGIMTVHGFDAMLKAEDIWLKDGLYDDEDWPMDPEKAVADIAARMGVAVDSRTVLNPEFKVQYPVDEEGDMTMREVLRRIAVANAGNWEISDAGELRLVPLVSIPEEEDYLADEDGNEVVLGENTILVDEVSESQKVNAGGGETFIGPDVAAFLPGLEALPITAVELIDEDGQIVGFAGDVSGDDAGRTLTAENPDGTDDMAAYILSQVEGYIYKPYEATDALLDPAAELGDGVTIDGLYSVIASRTITFDALYTADIAAPTTDEIEDEYPYLTAVQRVKRAIAGTRSLIAKTTSEILLKVEGADGNGGLAGKVAELSVTVDGVAVTTTNSDGTKTITLKDGIVTADALAVDSVTADKIAANTITFGKLDASTQATINNASNAASNAYSTAINANSKVSAWTYGGSTYIDGSKIMSGTVTASYLRGGIIDVKGADEVTYGIMYAGTNREGNTAFEVYGSNGLRLSSSGNIWAECWGGSGTKARLLLEDTTARIGPNLELTSGTQITSDRNMKHDIEYNLDAYDALFDALLPCRFKYNDGASDRYHTALIAQDVRDAILAAGLTTQDFAAYCERPVYVQDEDGNPTAEIAGYTCALRYDEFIALNIRQIQQLKARVAKLEEQSYGI